MVNLRFHIVSIAAVFLALAIGIVMGSSLLQRATVDSLKARQSSLETKIDDRVAENNAFRNEISLLEERDQEFEQDPMPALTEGMLGGDVVLVGVRGIDESQVLAIESDLAAAGAGARGVVWLDDSLDVADEGRRRAVAEALGAPELADDESATRDALVARLAAVLGSSTRSAPSGDGTAAPASFRGQELPADPGAELRALDDAGLVTWDAAPGSDTRALDRNGTRLVVLTGEGAQPVAADLVVPLLGALADVASAPPVEVEVMNPRSRLGAIERTQAGDTPERGDFVDEVRTDGDLAAKVITVDNGDQPFGRLALVLVLADADQARIGHYGETDSADGAFPPAS